MTQLFIVILPLFGIVAALLWGQKHRSLATVGVAAPVLAALALLLSQAPQVFGGSVALTNWPWIPLAGLNVAFRLDGLAFLFALLILGIGLLVILYARYYLSERDSMGTFYAYLMVFMTAMLGVVTAENLLLLVVFWELTSLSSFLLIGYWRHRADARQGARMALAVTGAGGLCLLAGVLLLGHIVGSYELSAVFAAKHIIVNHSLYTPMLVLVLLGAFSKSAQFPFHFWLPNAMAAPTPVSAYLHSATMVKAGVFLLARLHPALAGTDPWFYLVTGTGLVTAIMAAYGALIKHDLKGLLAYSTISHLGLITALFGFDTPMATVAGVFHITNHAAFKASLFMTAGIIDHETGSRDLRVLGGLRRAMPQTALLAALGCAAMAGLPLFNGFLSKEMFFEQAAHLGQGGSFAWMVPVIATIAGALSVAYSMRFVLGVFFGEAKGPLPKTPHEPPWPMKLPVSLLVALCLLVGVLPALVAGPMLAVASQAVIGGSLPEYHLAVWHGFNLPLLMSALAVGFGALLFSQRQIFFRLHDTVLPNVTASGAFHGGLHRLITVARFATRHLTNGSLQRYVLLLLLCALAAGAGPFLQYGWSAGPVASTAPQPFAMVIFLILVVGSLGTLAAHRHRVVALVLLGAVGLVSALAFVYLSAPDLALTQLSVEVVTILLLLMALNALPEHPPGRWLEWGKVRDLGVAGIMGTGVGLLAWGILTRSRDSISKYHIAESLPGGGGTNVVNVILVDFRGFDTLGEISVLGIAALAIFIMLEEARLTAAATVHHRALDKHPVLLTMISRPLLSLALLMATYILLRGHNLPGGGFVAGLVTGVALILQYVASGVNWAQERLRLDYQPLIALGVLAALATGIGSWLFDKPFLTSAFRHFHWPMVGEFELATAMVFDLGVFLAVVGTVMLILTNLGSLTVYTGNSPLYAKESSPWKP